MLARFEALRQRRIVVGLNGRLATPEVELHDGDQLDLLTSMSGCDS
jgi:molybdopterin converting factor small subunit